MKECASIDAERGPQNDMVAELPLIQRLYDWFPKQADTAENKPGKPMLP